MIGFHAGSVYPVSEHYADLVTVLRDSRELLKRKCLFAFETQGFFLYFHTNSFHEVYFLRQSLNSILNTIHTFLVRNIYVLVLWLYSDLLYFAWETSQTINSPPVLYSKGCNKQRTNIATRNTV